MTTLPNSNTAPINPDAAPRRIINRAGFHDKKCSLCQNMVTLRPNNQDDTWRGTCRICGTVNTYTKA